MTKTAYFPPHYVTVDAYAADLERELGGYQKREAELRQMGLDDTEGPMIDALSGQDAVRAELSRIGKGQEKRKPGRPRKEPEPEPEADE